MPWGDRRVVPAGALSGRLCRVLAAQAAQHGVVRGGLRVVGGVPGAADGIEPPACLAVMLDTSMPSPGSVAA